jgi:hypothetical protein
MKNILLMPVLIFILSSGYVNGQTARKPDRDTIDLTENNTRYRMIVAGDKMPEFFVNDKKINREDYGDYNEVIGKMQLMLTERKRKTKSSGNN